MMLIVWIVKIKKICVEASKVLLSKIITKVKSNIECKRKVKYCSVDYDYVDSKN